MVSARVKLLETYSSTTLVSSIICIVVSFCAIRLTSFVEAPVGAAKSAIVFGREPSCTSVSNIFKSSATRAARFRVGYIPSLGMLAVIL